MGRGSKASARISADRASWAGTAIAAGLRGQAGPVRPQRPKEVRTKPARQPVQEHVDATPERIAHAAGDHQIVDAIIDRAGERAKLTRRFADSAIDRMHKRGQLTYPQWYACDWYMRLHAEAMSAPRVVAAYGDGVGGCGSQSYGQPRNQHQWDARRKLREARAVIPSKMLALFDRVVVSDDMPTFGNGQQRARFSARIADAAQPLAKWLGLPV